MHAPHNIRLKQPAYLRSGNEDVEVCGCARVGGYKGVRGDPCESSCQQETGGREQTYGWTITMQLLVWLGDRAYLWSGSCIPANTQAFRLAWWAWPLFKYFLCLKYKYAPVYLDHQRYVRCRFVYVFVCVRFVLATSVTRNL